MNSRPFSVCSPFGCCICAGQGAGWMNAIGRWQNNCSDMSLSFQAIGSQKTTPISSDHPQATIIRADGKAVRSGKTLSGGFSVLKGNKLGVEKNLERMKTEVAQLHEK